MLESVFGPGGTAAYGSHRICSADIGVFMSPRLPRLI